MSIVFPRIGKVVLTSLIAVMITGLPVFAAEPPPATEAAQIIRGEVMIITDEFYLVVDQTTGKPTQLRLSKPVQNAPKDTKIQGPIKPGDKVEAQVEADGHALYIKKAE